MLTLITVNYNNAQATLELMRSLERQTDDNFDVLIVDNDSASEDRVLLGTYAISSPLKLDIIYSDANRGFSGGNNLAIRKAMAQGAQWLLLINNDTTVQPDFIMSLKLPAEPAVIGIPLREGDRIAYAGIISWLRSTLSHTYILEDRSSQLLYAIGAGMLIHRDVFDRVGLMDERFFLYFEDAEFSMRARRGGIAVVFLDGPVITHSVSQSTKHLGSPLLLRYHARNALLFNSIHGPWWVKGALPFVALFGIIFQSAKILLMPSRRAASRAIAAGIIDFYGKKFGKIRAE